MDKIILYLGFFNTAGRDKKWGQVDISKALKLYIHFDF